MKKPANRRYLDIAINNVCKHYGDPLRLRRILGAVIVAQMIPGGVLKGGSAMKIRFGDDATRFTKDLDAARDMDVAEYADRFARNLRDGWNGFTGRLVAGRRATPDGVPDSYVMQPFEVKLSYNNNPWLTVPFELGANELGDADVPEPGMNDDIVRIFEELGFPAPSPVPLMPVEHQIAQKLHGLTEQGSDRARDLVDLQIIVANGNFDYGRVRSLCERLFKARHLQPWPPRVVKGDEWDALYLEAKEDIGAILELDDAIEWANALIEKIAMAS